MTRHGQGQPVRYDGAIGFIALLIVALMLSVSPMALNATGWNYDGLGAAGPTRFHPHPISSCCCSFSSPCGTAIR